jgi:hypothetical protein
MDTPAYSVADASVKGQKPLGMGLSPETIKVGIFLALFIYGMTKDIKLLGQIMLAYTILHAIFN